MENYQTEGIRSIALPALGCGLGNLEWKEVGPMMCRHLGKMKVQAAIYPTKRRFNELLSPGFPEGSQLIFARLVARFESGLWTATGAEKLARWRS